jgi:hypothetical protein
MSSLHTWGKRSWNSSITATQAGSSSSATSTPRSRRKARSPGKVRASPTTTRGIWNSKIAPVHIWQGDSVVYKVVPA